MTHKQFRAGLDRLGWSMHHVARQLECDPKLVWRWAQGTAPVPDPVGVWVQTLVAVVGAHKPPQDWRIKG